LAIIAFIRKLSKIGINWTADERVAWLQPMVMGLQIAYGPAEPIIVKKRLPTEGGLLGA
jgi:hypothetical protein